jgi:two-component system response regulator VicR
MLPGMDGFEVCRTLRGEGNNVPIIMITAREEETDKVFGLELGADDYITKPFSMREVVARVRTNMRRAAALTAPAGESTGAVITAGELTVDPDRHAVYKNGRELELTQREYELIKFLIQNPGKVISRQELMTEVWQYDYYGDLRAVDVAVRRLREKIEDNPAEPAYVITKRGAGYYSRSEAAMKKSLYSKLMLIMLVVIVSLMAVVGAFLMRGVRTFYLSRFYEQMQSVFSSTEIAADLRSAADGDDAPSRMADIIKTYSGQLGIDTGNRTFYILTGGTGAYITGSDTPENGVAVTANITTAISGSAGYASDGAADYMDVALPISGARRQLHCIYHRQQEHGVRAGERSFRHHPRGSGRGSCHIRGLSLLLSKTLVTPLQELTRAAEDVADGDFSHKVSNQSQDEIGVLTRTFNNMAGQLEDTLDDLKMSEQTRREFVANVSHELRTPITSIRSYAETLEEDPDMDADTRHRFLDVIVNESDRMTKIVQDLLTLSRFDAGSIEFSFETFSFEKSVRDVYAATRMEAQNHRHEFNPGVHVPRPGNPRRQRPHRAGAHQHGLQRHKVHQGRWKDTHDGRREGRYRLVHREGQTASASPRRTSRKYSTDFTAWTRPARGSPAAQVSDFP